MKSILVLPYEIICPCRDAGEDAVQIYQYGLSRNPKHSHATLRKPHVPLRISFRDVASAMGFAVHFDDEPRLMAIKVGDIGTGWMLAAEFAPIWPLPKRSPQQDFGQGHLPTKFPCPIASPLQHWPSSSPCRGGVWRSQTEGCPAIATATPLRQHFVLPPPLPGEDQRSVRHQLAKSRSLTILPPWVRRMAVPISSSSTGAFFSLSQKAERKL